jgi:hypothetical protein
VRADYVEEVVVLTTRSFDLDDEGNVIVFGDDGRPSGSSVEDFFGKTFREQSPIFYPPANDGGSGKRISRSDFDKMDAQQKMAFFREGGQLFD